MSVVGKVVAMMEQVIILYKKHCCLTELYRGRITRTQAEILLFMAESSFSVSPEDIAERLSIGPAEVVVALEKLKRRYSVVCREGWGKNLWGVGRRYGIAYIPTDPEEPVRCEHCGACSCRS